MIQAVQDLKRLREISVVVVRHGFGELWDRAKIWDVLGRREEGQRPSPEELRATTARRFRETLAELGPTFIKLGQILSSRPDILPKDFIDELSHLQDRAAPMPVELVFQLIEKGLGKPAHQLFASIDPEPLASASIAQVHRARLASGEEVVVKVQRPGITLEELKGRKLKHVLAESGGDPAGRKLLARHILDASFHQLFTDGLFHGDPHPGNLIVLEGNRIGLLDFGLVGRLTKGMQESIILLVLAISLKDPDTVARLLYKVGVPDERINLHQFRADIHDILERYLGLKLNEVDPGVLMSELVDLAMKYKIKIPKEYAVLSKASATTEGIIRQLDPEMDITQKALPYAKQLLYERYNPSSM